MLRKPKLSSTDKDFLSLIQHIFVECLVYANSQVYKPMLVAEGGGRGMGVTVNGYGVSFWGDKIFWNLKEMVVVQHCECIKCH